jgi:ABC-type transport system involved in multi-copper enzyme maturation permease subunit
MTAIEAGHAPPARPRRAGFRPFRNPVVLKELRGRMRGMRAFVVLTVYLALMSGFVTLLYVLYSSSLSYYGFASGGQIGRVLFIGIVGTELFLVTFIAPTFTAGAISGERERQTYDLLRTTLLPARSLVLGKLVSALSYVLLLLLAAIPLQSIAFLFGGVTEAEVVLSFVILVVTAIALGSVGIYFSAVMQRTLTASIMTYGFALFVTLGLPLIVFVIMSLFGPLFYSMTAPPIPVQAALYYGFGALVVTNPLATAMMTEMLLVNSQHAGFFMQTLTSGAQTAQIPLVSPWIVFTILYLVVSAILVTLAIRRVRRIEA